MLRNRAHRQRPWTLPSVGAQCARLVFVALLLVVPWLAWATDEMLMEARTLAFSGKAHRPEALALLQQRLTAAPDDNEARVLYGIVLSWEGRYVEARAQLETIVEQFPDHGDALPALINVELWSDHPARAEQLAHDALQRQPRSVPLMLADARALRNLQRRSEALQVLDQALAVEPNNQEARKMRRALSNASRKWETGISHSSTWFSGGRGSLQESSVELRGPTPLGSAAATFNRAEQYGWRSYQSEADIYPHFRDGTYANFNLGYSADANLYPRYRLGADLFQSLGHGYELSGGFRRLSFSGGVNIYTFALAKYYGDWLFTGRGFLTPGAPGTSGTAVLSARHFFSSEGRHDYIEFRFSQGASPALANTVGDIEVLSSSRFSVELDKALHGRWVAACGGSVGTEQRVGQRDLNRYSLQGSIFYRF